MANLEDNLSIYLAARSGVTALVSARIYKMRIPQRTALPAITYMRVGGSTVYHQTAAATIRQARVSFTAWALTYSSAKAVIEAIRNALSGYAGAIGTAPNTTTILWSEHTGDDVDGEVESDNGQDAPQAFSVTADYEIRYRETVPTLT
jgi:hypothetical protein